MVEGGESRRTGKVVKKEEEREWRCGEEGKGREQVGEGMGSGREWGLGVMGGRRWEVQDLGGGRRGRGGGGEGGGG